MGHRAPRGGRPASPTVPSSYSRNRSSSDKRSIRLRVAGLRVGSTGGGLPRSFSAGREFAIRNRSSPGGTDYEPVRPYRRQNVGPPRPLCLHRSRMRVHSISRGDGTFRKFNSGVRGMESSLVVLARKYAARSNGTENGVHRTITVGGLRMCCTPQMKGT